MNFILSEKLTDLLLTKFIVCLIGDKTSVKIIYTLIFSRRNILKFHFLVLQLQPQRKLKTISLNAQALKIMLYISKALSIDQTYSMKLETRSLSKALIKTSQTFSDLDLNKSQELYTAYLGKTVKSYQKLLGETTTLSVIFITLIYHTPEELTFKING